jgi:hypothetical protein
MRPESSRTHESGALPMESELIRNLEHVRGFDRLREGGGPDFA